jgi:glutaredoxin
MAPLPQLAAAPIRIEHSYELEHGAHWLMSLLGVLGLVLAAAFVAYLLGGDDALAFLDGDAAVPVAIAQPPLRGLPPPAPGSLAHQPSRPTPNAVAARQRPRAEPLAQRDAPARTTLQLAEEQAQDVRRRQMIEGDRDQRALKHARENITVVMYSTTWCPACKAARAYMVDKGIAFVDNDVDSSPSAAEILHRLNPRGSIPTIDVDGEIMVGFGGEDLEDMIDRAARKRAGL